MTGTITTATIMLAVAQLCPINRLSYAESKNIYSCFLSSTSVPVFFFDVHPYISVSLSYFHSSYLSLSYIHITFFTHNGNKNFSVRFYIF